MTKWVKKIFAIVFFPLLLVARLSAVMARWPVFTFAFAYLYANGGSMRGAVLLIASLAVSFFAWGISTMTGYEISRRKHLTRLKAFLDADRDKYHASEALRRELLVIFSSEFHAKRVSQRQASSLSGTDISSPELVVLVPNADAESEMLKPPRACPNYRDESVIIFPSDLPIEELETFDKFLLYHEVEHCTPDAFKVEGHQVVGLVRAFTFGLLLLVAVKCVALGFALGVVAVVFQLLDYLVWQPAQIEYRTDCRAMSKLSQNEVIDVITKHIAFCNKRKPPRRRWLSVYFDPWEFRLFCLKSLQEAYLKFGMNSKVLRSFGNLSMFEAMYGIPTVCICLTPLFADVSLEWWMLVFPFAVAFIKLYQVQKRATNEADRLLEECRLKMPTSD